MCEVRLLEIDQVLFFFCAFMAEKESRYLNSHEKKNEANIQPSSLNKLDQ